MLGYPLPPRQELSRDVSFVVLNRIVHVYRAIYLRVPYELSGISSTTGTAGL